MNLPKHIEERFENLEHSDECEFSAQIVLECSCGRKTIKSFIAQILEEEKDRLVGEIVDGNIQEFRDDSFAVEIGDRYLQEYKAGFNDAIQLINKKLLNLIKK